MAEKTAIEWTDHTFNPWVGCTKVSPGCDNCYAEAMMDHRLKQVQWGPHGERKLTSDANWSKPIQWDRKAKLAKTRGKVFCASLADWLDNKASAHWRESLAVLIDETPNLDWLLLTKRLENWGKLSPWHDDEIPKNVWIGASVENQEQSDRRGRQLREIGDCIKFLSCEPLLTDITFDVETMQSLDLVIVGGESGAHRRFMQPAWAEHIHDQCRTAGVNFFMKQMTGKTPIPSNLMVREMPVSRASL